MTKANSAFRIPHSAFLAPLVLAAYFLGLTIPFVGPDEARYAQVAREMFERGDWITPTLGGFNWFEKPALLYWLQIASYHVFGVSEFAARLGPALCGLGTLVSLWILGRQFEISNFKSEIVPDYKFAKWLTLIAATTLSLIVFAKGASFDIVITFTITASLVGYFVFAQSESNRQRRAGIIGFYIFIGFSILAKGLIGLLFPFAIVFVYHVFSRRWPARSFLMSLLWGLPLVIVIAAIWYLPMYLKHGWPFIDEFFIQHHFARFTSNKYLHPQPFYFYLWILPLLLLPWTPFFFAAIVRRVRKFASSPLLLFSLSWLIVPLAFFSFSGSKLPGYILPAVPAAAVITSLFVFELANRSPKWRYAVLTLITVTIVATIILLQTAVPAWADRESVKSLLAAANERGYPSNRLVSLHTLSHNAEFYFAGRLLRDDAGKQVRLSTIAEVEEQMQKEGGRALLVLIPVEHTSQLTRQPRLNTEIIHDNGELSIAAVWFK